MYKQRKVTTYKGFKIHQVEEDGIELFKVYTKEEWSQGPFRSSEWDACSMEEAHQFIDSYDKE